MLALCDTAAHRAKIPEKNDLRNQNFIFTTTFGALQSTEGGCSGEVVVASGDAAMGVAGLRRALGGRHAAHGGRGAGQAAAAAGRGARRRERWKSGRATRRATGDGAAGLCGCTAGCPPSRRRASPWRRSWTKKVGPGSDDAGSSSVPEDLRSFPGDGASVLVSSGGSLAGDTVRVTVRSEDVGVLGPLAPKKSSGSQYEIFNALQAKSS